LEGKNQDDGAVFIESEPGSRMKYSGGGYVIAQMIIEDVSGEPFATFMEREVAKPLHLSSLGWVWTPQLERRAPTPYDHDEKPVGYRQLASQPSAARFVLCLTLLDSWPRLSQARAANLLAEGSSNERPFQPCSKRSRAKSSSVMPVRILAGMPFFGSALSGEKGLSSRTTPAVERRSTNPSATCGQRHVGDTDTGRKQQ
jgi:CubicO group peptidase (beta-lactamase class C family)